MKNLSKILAMLLAIVMVLGIAGCTGGSTESSAVESSQSEESSGSENSGESSQGSSESSEVAEGLVKKAAEEAALKQLRDDRTTPTKSKGDFYAGSFISYVKPTAGLVPKNASKYSPMSFSNVKYAETLTLTTIVDASANASGDYSNNAFTNAYKDEINIVIDNQEVIASKDEYTAKVDALISAGTLPDFLYMNIAQFKTAHGLGLLKALDEVYDQYATDDLKVYTDSVDAWVATATRDGARYGLIDIAGGCYAVDLLCVRSDWRKACGVSADDLVYFEDFVELQRKMLAKYKDNDIVGFTGSFSTANDRNLLWMLNAFGAYKGIWIEDEETGDLVYSTFLPEMRVALEELSKLYAEGIIDPDFYTSDSSITLSNINSGKTGFYTAKQWYQIDGVAADVVSKIETYKVPVSKTLPAGTKAKTQTTTSYNGIWVVSADCANPEAIIHMANMFADKIWHPKNSKTEAEFRNASSLAAIRFNNGLVEHYYNGVEAKSYWSGSKAIYRLTDNSVAGITGTLTGIFGKNGSLYDYVEIMDQGLIKSDMLTGQDSLKAYQDEITKLKFKLPNEQNLINGIIRGQYDITKFDEMQTKWETNLANMGKAVNDNR